MKKFKLFKMLLVAIGLLVTSVPQMWAHQFNGGVTVFYDNYITESDPPYFTLKDGSSNQWDETLTQIGSTSFYYKYFQNNSSGFAGWWMRNSDWSNKSKYQEYGSSSSCVVVVKAKGTEKEVGFFTTYKKAYPSTRVYFDATPIDGWGDKAYLRYGFDCVAHADAMTKVPGTASLFYIDVQEAYYEKYAVANNAGWTKAYNVSQPSDKCQPDGEWEITKSLAFSTTDINNTNYGHYVTTFVPTEKSATNYGCDWWNYSKNEDAGMPTHDITISSTTNGKIRVEYTDTDGDETYWEGSGGTTITVPQSAIITIKALGNAGYDASSVSVAGNSFTNGNTYTVTSDITISATFVTAYAYVQGRMHVKSGSPTGSWINTFDGEGDSDKWEESSSVIQLTHDGTKYVLHTYATPSDLSSDFEGSLPPYFYVATSSSNSGYTGLRKYRPSEGLTITAANSKATIKEFSGGNSVRINSDVTTGYVVLYFDQSDVWYLLEQSLDYAAGDGSGDAPSTTYHINGTTVTAAAANTFTAPTGYHFDHWAGSNSTNYNAGATVTMSAHLTLTAQWAANTYTVTFDKESGTGGAASVTATYDAAMPSATMPTRSGYYFEGYWDSDNGTGTKYYNADGTSARAWDKTSNTTLYAKWRLKDVYTFHYGADPGSPCDGVYVNVNENWTSGTVEPFVGGSNHFWSISNFTMPDPSTSPKYFVCYEEKFKSILNADGETASASTVTALTSLPLYPSGASIGIAIGAKGTLELGDSSNVANLGAHFIPSGYKLVYNSGTIAFTQTTTDSIWETEAVTLVAGDISGTFKVQLKTSDGSVDFGLSSAENASAVDARKISGTSNMASGAKGRFQIRTKRNTTNFALRFVPMENKTIANGSWNGTYGGGSYDATLKWSLGRVPTIEDDVVIAHPTTVYKADAKAHSVKIDKTSSSTLRLNIESEGGLLVATTITAKHEGDADYGATTPEDLQIETSILGNGSLICGSASTSTQATYHFYSKSWKYNSWFVNQYVGIPFETCSAYDYYSMNVYEYDASKDSWKAPGSSTLESFTCYNMINKYNGAQAYYYLDGILELPGTTNKVLTCGSRYSSSKVFDGGEGDNGDYMFANSWTAPISVKDLAGCVDGLLAEVHIFNAGFVDPKGESEKAIGTLAGQWTGFSFAAAEYMEDAVIPATQAFCVTATKDNATLTLKYKEHVYDPANENGSINTYPTRAPRRAKATDPTVLRVIVRSDSAIADNIYLFEREDFTNEYDNGWDCRKLFGKSSVPQLYAIQGEGKVSISAIPDMEGALLGFKAGTDANSYTFDFEYNDEEPLYLYDKDTKEVTQIDNEATYSFTTNDTAEHDRFMITRSNAPQVITGYEEIEGEKVKRAEKFIENNTLFIRRGGRIYDATGSLVK